MTQELPLFPLSTVLFPGAPLTLHIFEERYRQMIGRCIEERTPFGVIRIRDGQEVGDSGVSIHSIGTVAEITEHMRLDDGRYYLSTVGRQRFRVQYPTQRQPYLTAQVMLLDDEASQGARNWANELRRLYARYWEAMARLTGQDESGEEIEIDAIGLSYQLAHLLQVPSERKQQWLETDTLARLRAIAAALQQELRMLPAVPRGGDAPSLGSLN